MHKGPAGSSGRSFGLLSCVLLTFLIPLNLDAQLLSWTVRQASLSKVSGEVRDSAIDEAGNLLVVADSNAMDFLVAKFDPEGTPVWLTQFERTPYPYSGQGEAILLGDSGELYVAATTSNSENKDISLVKFDASGGIEWSRHFDGGYRDAAVDLEHGAFGQIVITGAVYGPDTYADMVTLWYAANGDLVRSEIFAIEGEESNAPGDLDVSPSGDVFVCGKYLVKYSEFGLFRWSRQVASRTTCGVATDNGGGVFVGGTVEAIGDANVVVSRYDGSGNLTWLRTLDGSTGNDDIFSALAWEAEANSLVVTGASRGDSADGLDMMTAKFESSGNLLWRRNWSGIVYGDDEPLDIVVAETGEVLVAGRTRAPVTYCCTDLAVIQYSAGGAENWVRTFNGPGEGFDQANSLALSLDGGVWVSGVARMDPSFSEPFTLKYSASGTLSVEVPSPEVAVHESTVSSGRSLDVDAEGFSYAVSTVSEAGGESIGISKLDGDGTVQWFRRYRDPEHGYTFGGAMARSPDGGIVVLGNTTARLVTLKYDEDGKLLWLAEEDGGNAYQSVAGDVGVDSDGNVYVAGALGLPPGGLNYRTLKYSPAGLLLWGVTHNVQGSSSDLGTQLGLMDDGVVVSGFSRWGTEVEIATVAYDENGLQLWAAEYSGPVGSTALPLDLVVDSSNNVTVAGIVSSVDGDFDGVALRYSASGIQQWATLFAGDPEGDDAIRALEPQADGAVIVGGDLSVSGGGTNLLVARLDSDGEETWQSTLDHGAYEGVLDLALRPEGSIVAAGWTVGAVSQDFLFARWNSAGELTSSMVLDGGSGGQDSTSTLAVDGNGDLLACGVSVGPDGTKDVVVMKLLALTALFSDGFESGGIEGWDASFP